MQEQIKELRVRIDGLSQLVKNLKPTTGVVIDLMKIPEDRGLNIDRFMEYFNNQGWAFVQNNDSGNAVQILDLNKELQKSYDSLILAKAWLGKILELLGTESPYKNDGKRKSIEDIEPTADSSKVIESLNKYPEITNTFEGLNWKEATHIEKVDKLREEIKKIITTTPDFSENCDYIELEQGFVYKYLCEARFWLGWELQVQKEYADKSKFWEESKSE
jgi:hypothetical protein